MDWLRAKILFIVAFLCLDAFLGWEVSRLTVPLLYLEGTAPPAAQEAPLGTRQGVYVLGPLQAPQSPPQKSAPPLEVATVGVDRQALALLVAPYSCAPPGPLGPLYSSDCTDRAGAEVRQLGGALVYTAPWPLGEPQRSPRGVADAIVRTVDPVNVIFTGAGAAGGAGQTTVLHYLETYDGVPLFDGVWTVDVGPRRVSATRFWLRVLARRAAAPVISATQAVDAAAVALGADPSHPLVVRGPALFGYYFPIRQPPAEVVSPGGTPVPRIWQLVPVWRVRLAPPPQGCLFINAYSGQPEEALSTTPLVGPC